MWKDSLRAGLRNLYVNAVLSATIIFYYFIRNLLVYTEPTENIRYVLSLVLIVLLIGWVLFLCHWVGETILEIRRKNYSYLWSFLPFLLPPIFFLLHNWILSFFPVLV